MYKRKASWLKHLDFMIWDVLCLWIMYTLAYWLHNKEVLFFENIKYQQMIVVITIANVFTGLFFESYRSILRRGKYLEFKAVLKHISITATIVFIYMFFFQRGSDYSRLIYAGTMVVGGIIIYVVHLIWKEIIRKRVSNNVFRPHVLVIANYESARTLLRELLHKEYVDYHVVGCVIYDQDGVQDSIEEIPVVCEYQDIITYVQKNIVDEIFIQPDGIGEEFKNSIQDLVRMGLTVHVELTKIYGEFCNASSNRFGNYAVTTISMGRARIRQLVLKRMLDIIGSVIGLFITGMAFIIVAPIIKLQSHGPIFFSQIRVGKNGRRFKIYKFRSMYIDAEERKKELEEKNKMQGPMFKMENDPRITPIGRFIRKWSVDELPQFWNVLKGDMSLVGTRPPTVEEFQRYDKHHRVRLSIKSGVTGLWQVSGRSDIVDFEDIVKLDEKYIKEWNLGLDVKILCQTVLVVFGRKGSI
jgi:exopolysaccharide biosynthesis polyprenyl glycosylphosphotransferase